MEFFNLRRNVDERSQLLKSISRSQEGYDSKNFSTGLMPCFIPSQSEAMLLGLSVLSLSIYADTYTEN